MKSFKNIKEFLNSIEFKNKDLSYCDLSNLDLSKIENYEWKDFTFFHTNFKNTNIKFFPQSLKRKNNKVFLEYCDFTGCNLSYLQSYQFEFTSIDGSCFIDTNLYIALDDTISFKNTLFPTCMAECFINSISLTQVGALETNSHLFFTSLNLKFFLNRFYSKTVDKYLMSNKLDLYVENIQRILEIDKRCEGNLYRLFEILGGENFSKMDYIHFTGEKVYSKNYEDIDFSIIPFKLLQDFNFYNCTFKSVMMPNDTIKGLKECSSIDFDFYDLEKDKTTNVPYIIIPKLNASSWHDVNIERLGYTRFTTQTNLYLELGRYCNANCFFCRNQYLEPCKYDFDAILNNLKILRPYLDNIVIGGGEPTLIKKDLYELKENLYYSSIKLFISTNGSCSYDWLKKLLKDYNLNISRHAIEDADNNQIFGIKTIDTESIKNLIDDNYSSSKVTLVATCFKGGLDTVDNLLYYIELSDYVGANVLFQNLHEDLESENSKQILDCIFDEVIEKLKEQGYIVEELPIYSTGDYKLIIVKSINEKKTISFKKYITKEELEQEWFRASKRTFDLSMAPNGDIYENWNQKSNLVLTKNLIK